MDELKQRIAKILKDNNINTVNKEVQCIMQEIEKYDNSCSMALEHIKEENIFDIDTLSKFSIVDKRYNTAYFRLVSIASHLRECDYKYLAFINHSIKTETKLYLKKEFKKELADLFILIYLEIINNPSFKQTIDERLDKFIENIKNDKKEYSNG